ncbi:cyclic nucleotide-binding domain-containing protein [Methylopila sp. M107]|uniref:cyclic nucleotide-binding domain-containing protein n=1 Tax=Methylopila sp. M107 TaxID=1101190 RepID=UPI00036FAED8|nr:cyclic nucleotide-binding domain-containing protein [Methylopila sp. M107]
MALEDDIRTLGETPMLDQLGRDAQRLIAFSAERVRLAEGEALFREGDRADTAFVVASGSLILTRGATEKRVGRATLVGELALLVDVARPATATAAEPTELLRIARSLFTRLFDEYPELAGALRGRLMAKVQTNMDELKAIEARLRK